MTSLAFSRFYESFFGDMYLAWHDGLDVASIRELTAEERVEAERLLREALPSGDWRIPAGLAALQSMQSAPEMKAQIGKAQGRARINMAMALWEIEQWADAPRHIAEELRGGLHWGDRIDAARAMRRLGAAADQGALWHAIEHDDTDLVRYHSVHSLLIVRGLHPNDESTHPLALEMMSADADKRGAAVAALRSLVNGNSAG